MPLTRELSGAYVSLRLLRRAGELLQLCADHPDLAAGLRDRFEPFAARVGDAAVRLVRSGSGEPLTAYEALDVADRALLALRVARSVRGREPELQGVEVALDALRGAVTDALPETRRSG